MKRFIIYVLSFALLAACGSDNDVQKKETEQKVRTVITTDGEVDDMNSVIRFMYYANEVDLKGIVLTSSVYHYAGDEQAGISPYRWTGTEWITQFIDAYADVYKNLKVHADGYPAPDFLKKVTKIGNISNVGEMEKITDGSEFLKNLILDSDNSDLYIQTWGGTNTTARALKSIQEQYEGTASWGSIKKAISNKVIIYIILDQDDSYGNYIAKEWPDIRIINDRSNFWRFAYAWTLNPSEVNNLLKGEWLYSNIKTGHGALLDHYALMGDGNYIEGELPEEQRGTDEYLESHPSYNRYDFISEGDSPSFLYLFDNGLRSLEDPSYGGWGGRFGKVSDKLFKNTVLDFDPYTNRYEAEYSLMRWFDDIQNDFAARADWGITANYKDANHYPKLQIKEGLDLSVSPGEQITLHAVATDPDGDQLSYKWWHYFEADTYQEYTGQRPDISENMISINQALGEGEIPGGIALEGSDTNMVTFVVPENAKSGDTIHIIAEVVDDGVIPLKRYQRVILTVK